MEPFTIYSQTPPTMFLTQSYFLAFFLSCIVVAAIAATVAIEHSLMCAVSHVHL